MNFHRYLVCLTLLVCCALAHGAEFTSKVIAVLDGDTVLVRRDRGLLKVRLAGIDAPEKAQDFGEASKLSLSEMVLGNRVEIISVAVDQYSRMIARLSVNGLDVNAEQVRRGMAWEYSRFASVATHHPSRQHSIYGNRMLIALQEEARMGLRGLWTMGNPVPPWQWRKLHPLVDQPNTTIRSNFIAVAETFPDIACGNKKYCSEMLTCEEARHYLIHCRIEMLDGNADGVPCEKLCGGIKSGFLFECCNADSEVNAK